MSDTTRCTLCGGRVVGGRCRECGLDNTKNDKKYNLNKHNDSGIHLHEGECDDILNKMPKKAGAKKAAVKNVSDPFVEAYSSAEKKAAARKKKTNGNGKTVLGVILVIYLIIQFLPVVIAMLQNLIFNNF